MRKLAIPVCSLLMVVCALGADGLEMYLLQAGESSGDNYVKLREAALQRGQTVLQDLKKAAVNATLTWRQRLVARIWIEWLERNSQIEALRRYEWERGEGFTPDMLSSRAGPWVKMMPFIMKRLKEQRLWYYYCEVVALRTEEQWPVAHGYGWLIEHTSRSRWFGSRWGLAAWGALKDEPEFYYYVAGMRETLRADPELKTELALKAFVQLEHQQIADATPNLLRSFLAYRSLRELKEPVLPGSRVSHLRDLIRIAGPQHATMFDEFISAHPEFAALQPAVDALRKKPPAKEWEEPTYSPTHESESLKAAVSKP